MTHLSFKLEKTAEGSRARACRLFLTPFPDGLPTPIFMPVGTQATVKGMTVESLSSVGSNILLANTYHLMLRPGTEVFDRFQGIHRFMNWKGAVLTDSGGFQIFSLADSRSITDEGAAFQSYVDGKKHLLSPEESIRVQSLIGSDIMMVLDECITSTAPYARAKEAMERTHRWALRSFSARKKFRETFPQKRSGSGGAQALFAIVQGACFKDLRKASADFLTSIDFDGFAIGGLAVGESKAEREDFTALVTEYLPTDRPRYLMGVGTPLDILEAVHRGVDLFDCIIPSSLARQGNAFTSIGRVRLRRGAYKLAEESLDPDCDCATCAHYSRAYLHHLIKSDEWLGWKLLTQHNLRFYHRLMADIRRAIEAGKFLRFYEEKRKIIEQDDPQNPIQRPEKKSC